MCVMKTHFVYSKPDIIDTNNILKEESEISFGLFFVP